MSAQLDDLRDPFVAAEQAVDAGDFYTAIRIYEGLVEPGGEMLAGIINNLVPLYLKVRKPFAALQAAQALTFFAPRSVDAWMALANMRERFADWEGALQALHQVLDLDPMHEGAHQSRLFLLSSHAPAGAVRGYHQDWMDTLLGPLYRPFIGQVDRSVGKQLRVGYVSGDFRKHVMDRVLLPLLQYHSDSVKVFCYDTVDRPDDITDIMRACRVQWRILKGLDDQQAFDLIKADGIDILVDMSGITFGQRLKVFALRPAPIQVTTTGYLPTTGAKCFDWKIVDSTVGPSSDYTEPLWRVRNALCPHPLPGAPAVTPLPAKQNGFITFGSVNSYAKVTRECVDTWTEILQRVPNSRLVMVVAGCSEQATAIAVLRRFGPVQDRVMLTEWQTGHRFPNVFADLDIALNSFPYGGCMTSFDTLWQGTPIITLYGDRTVGRYASHYMASLKMPEFIAHDRDAYVRAAMRAAVNLDGLEQIRHTLRDQVRSHPIFNVPAWALSMEETYREMWKRYVRTSAAG